MGSRNGNIRRILEPGHRRLTGCYTAHAGTAGGLGVFTRVHQANAADHRRRSRRACPEAEMSKLHIPNNDDDSEALPDRRAIGLVGGWIEENLDEIEEALIEQRVGVFRRNGGLVRPGTVAIEVRNGETIEAVGLIEVGAGSLIEIITSCATTIVMSDRRQLDWPDFGDGPSPRRRASTISGDDYARAAAAAALAPLARAE